MFCMLRSERSRDVGLLVLRIGLGIMFIYHGLPKIMAGPEMWNMLGQNTARFGITFAPTFWGFMAAFAEFGGGILILIGLLTRLACFLLVINLMVAASMHLATATDLAKGFGEASHAIEDGIVFLALIFIGAGRYSLDAQLCQRKGGAPELPPPAA